MITNYNIISYNTTFTEYRCIFFKRFVLHKSSIGSGRRTTGMPCRPWATATARSGRVPYNGGLNTWKYVIDLYKWYSWFMLIPNHFEFSCAWPWNQVPKSTPNPAIYIAAVSPILSVNGAFDGIVVYTSQKLIAPKSLLCFKTRCSTNSPNLATGEFQISRVKTGWWNFQQLLVVLSCTLMTPFLKNMQVDPWQDWQPPI